MTAAQAVQPVTANISMNVNEEVKVAAPGISLTIDTDKINQEMPIIPPPQPADGQIDMQMNIPVPNINMQVSGDATYHQEVTIDGVTTQSTTRRNIPAPQPAMASTDIQMNMNMGMPTISAVASGDDDSAQVQMNMGMGMPAMSAVATGDDDSATAQVSIGGMNMQVSVDNQFDD